VLKLQTIHGNTLHSATHFQAVVLKGAAEVGSYLRMGEKKEKKKKTLSRRGAQFT